ncbi:catalase-domain-containing protein [Paraphaeosphaeria sporulosa]|uniref:Catalase n=1 Tax=Paraphaeosphaeria sporulosa TaxID=1460663 RepID=A0A177CFV8_9PLEO|nr:catalase-domain-containing protein [Paraphaeosphaeria sporulosa]OAG05842.1 catalase-domain-containing protein [Paraphaeosphaeria sporulosa]
MASSILSQGKEKIQEAMSAKDTKAAQLAANTKDVHDPSYRITSDWGTKQSNTDDWLKVATEDKTGPMLLEDGFSREKIQRFDHERIPERVVHARGVGAFGKFTLFESAADVTSAKVLTDTSRETPVFVRFSTVLGSRGSADTVRDVRGFAVKHYTEEGNWDIVGNNIPVFFIQDALKFPDVIHAGKPEPHNEIPQAQSAHNNFWDFQYLHPETTHMQFWTMSDRSIPRSLRMMQGFGVNTFTLINDKGERNFVKFHYTPELGVHSLVWDEALKIAGQDPDFHRKDLYTAIESGAYPKWKFGIQCIPEGKEDDFDFDILDATKVWPEELVPIRYIGELELNRNPDEYFTQTEQVAFATGHLVPGIGFSDDPLLQGRNFSYQDTQLSRLGINWEELPINKPVCPVMNHNRDGAMRHTITKGTVNYWPNRFQSVPPATKEEGGYVDFEEKVVGIKTRLRSKKFQEHKNQAELFYNSLSEPEKTHMMNAFAFELDHCDDPIVYERMTQRIAEIDFDLAKSVAEMVGGEPPKESNRPKHNKKAKGLSQLDFAPAKPTIATRMIAIMIADGYDAIAYNGIKAALMAAGALPFTIAPRRNKIFAAGEDKSTGKGVVADHHLEGMRSTMFDSVFIPGGAESVATLRKNGRAIHWVREAFGHLKAIGATGEGVQFVKDACDLPGMEFSTSGEVVDSYGVVTASEVSPQSFKEAIQMAKGAKDFVDAYTFAISQHKNFDRETAGLNAMVAY